MEHTYDITPGQIFTLFFIMLGPFRMLGAFLKETKEFPMAKIHSIAWRASVISAIALIICGYFGKLLLDNWKIPVPILLLTSGIIFFSVGMNMILKNKSSPVPAPSAAQAAQGLNGLAVALRMIITPYGAAILVCLLALSRDTERDLIILLCLLLVMFTNYVGMYFNRTIMKKGGLIVLQILGIILGILQAALAINMIFIGIKMLNS